MKWGTLAALTGRGRERHGSAVTQQHAQRPPKPPPHALAFSPPKLPAHISSFFFEGADIAEENRLTKQRHCWVCNKSVGSSLPPHNAALLTRCPLLTTYAVFSDQIKIGMSKQHIMNCHLRCHSFKIVCFILPHFNKHNMNLLKWGNSSGQVGQTRCLSFSSRTLAE